MLHTYLLRMLRRMTRWACSHSHYVHNDIEICWQFSDYVRHKPMISTYCASETYMYSILSPVLFGNVPFQFTEFYLSLLFFPMFCSTCQEFMTQDTFPHRGPLIYRN